MKNLVNILPVLDGNTVDVELLVDELAANLNTTQNQSRLLFMMDFIAIFTELMRTGLRLKPDWKIIYQLLRESFSSQRAHDANELKTVFLVL